MSADRSFHVYKILPIRYRALDFLARLKKYHIDLLSLTKEVPLYKMLALETRLSIYIH